MALLHCLFTVKKAAKAAPKAKDGVKKVKAPKGEDRAVTQHMPVAECNR